MEVVFTSKHKAECADAVHTPRAAPRVAQPALGHRCCHLFRASPARAGLLSMQNLAAVILFLPKRTSCLSQQCIGPLGCNSFQGLGSVWVAELWA